MTNTSELGWCLVEIAISVFVDGFEQSEFLCLGSPVSQRHRQSFSSLARCGSSRHLLEIRALGPWAPGPLGPWAPGPLGPWAPALTLSTIYAPGCTLRPAPGRRPRVEANATSAKEFLMIEKLSRARGQLRSKNEASQLETCDRQPK